MLAQLVRWFLLYFCSGVVVLINVVARWLLCYPSWLLGSNDRYGIPSDCYGLEGLNMISVEQVIQKPRVF